MGDRHYVEARLRASLTDTEYTRVIRKLCGAIDALQILTMRAPDCVQHFFPHLPPAPEEEVPERARIALEGLIRELRAAKRATKTPPMPLRIVRSRTG